jgi:hypothetical protein
VLPDEKSKKATFPCENGLTAFLGHPGVKILSSGLPYPYFRSVFTEYVKKIKI